MSIPNEFRMTIDGRLEGADAVFGVINPATEQLVGHAPECSPEQLDKAVAAARRAFGEWKRTTIAERAAILRAIADRIEQNAESLAHLLMQEQGKPLADARGEIARSAVWFRYMADRDLSPELRKEADGRTIEVRRVPIGVVGAISPWNLPVSLAVWKIAPALLAGNSLVVKPSPFTPLTTLKLGELLLDLLPAGVLNIVSGGDSLGPLLSEHPGIDKIAFTGSTATGRAVMRSAARNLKRVTLELGGNDPAIVFPDVDVEEVAEKLFWGAFRNAGQICIAAKRIYVHDAIYDRFAARMRELAETNRPGPGDQPGVRIGPVQNRAQYSRVKELIAEARDAGYGFVTDPGDIEGPGYFIAPTIVDNPPDTSRIVTEEPFGPVVPLLRFSDVDDVIRRANDSEYGLGASVWTNDAALAASVSERLEAGIIWHNAIQVLTPSTPFGGHKQSGIGVESSEEGLLEYTNIQVFAR